MKNIPLYSLLACLSIILPVSPTLGQAQLSVLARVEAVDRVDKLGLPVYAHLRDAKGQAYALVVATTDKLAQAGWPFTVLAHDPDVANLSIAIERMPGALAQVRKRSDVLYDDGRRLIMMPSPKQKRELIGMGLAIIRINTPMVWPAERAGRTALQAPRAVTANPAISNIMYQINQDAVSNRTAQLDGEAQAMIGGEPYTILTRGTSSGTPILKANQFVYEQLQAAGLEVSYQGWTSNSYSGSNIVGVKRGATLSNEVILVTAHIDSIPNDGTRSPGADDNASGCVGVMLAANALKGYSTERTVRFICFGGEEQSLLGSDTYAQSIHHAGETNVTVFNMDMLAYSTIPSREMYLHTRLSTAPGYAEDMAVANTFRDVLSIYGLNGQLTLVITNSGEESSDHYSFWQQGYPGVLAIESDNNFNPNCHKASDSIANINLEYFTDFVRASVGTVAHLAGVLPPPVKAAGVQVSDGTFKDKVRISWLPVEDATGYRLWRNKSNDCATAQLLGSTTATIFDDTRVEVNHIYYYWVQATNSYGAGEFSDPDSGYDLLGPFIWANDLDEDVVINQGSNVTVYVEIEPDMYAGINADWWVVACDGSAWYYLNRDLMWMPEGNALYWHPVCQGPLGDVPPTEVLNTSCLPVGSYTFWFAVDSPMDGILNLDGPIWVDSVNVIVQ